METERRDDARAETPAGEPAQAERPADAPPGVAAGGSESGGERSTADAATAGAEAGAPLGEAARDEGQRGEAQQIPLAALLASVPAQELLGTFCQVLAAKAWEGMGLVPNAMTNKVQKNLDEARVAIDAYAAVLEVLRVRLEPHPRQEMENVLTMLRVNFVDKSSA